VLNRSVERESVLLVFYAYVYNSEIVVREVDSDSHILSLFGPRLDLLVVATLVLVHGPSSRQRRVPRGAHEYTRLAAHAH